MRTLLAVILLGLPALAAAAPPRVVADIAPVHSLVAQVMAGVAAPALLLAPGVSPHNLALRPSEAATLAQADLVVWIGPALIPGLERSLASLAPDAAELRLLDSDATRRLPVRTGTLFAPTDDPGKGATDPHAWLDPANARAWLDTLAETLAGLDPTNAATYRANAATAQAGIDATLAAIAAPPLAPVIAYHDAYRYLEEPLGLTVLGAITPSDAAAPSPARLAALRDLVAERGVTCLLAEPPVNTGLVDAVFQATPATVAILDPMGRTLDPGPGFYTALLRDLAAALATCP